MGGYIRFQLKTRFNLERLGQPNVDQNLLIAAHSRASSRAKGIGLDGSDTGEWLGVTTAIAVRVCGYSFGLRGDKRCIINIGTRTA